MMMKIDKKTQKFEQLVFSVRHQHIDCFFLCIYGVAVLCDQAIFHGTVKWEFIKKLELSGSPGEFLPSSYSRSFLFSLPSI